VVGVTVEGASGPGLADPDSNGAGGAPLVSVVIPTIRGGDMLRQAVASVLDQTMGDLEVVVVCNRPGVDTSLLPGDRRVRVLHEERPAKAYAVNRGAFAARGTWLALLDDDDTWIEEKLERQLEVLGRWEGVPACVSNFVRVDENGETISKGVAKRGTFIDMIAGRTVHLPSTLILRRDLFIILGGFNPSFKVTDDYDFFLRLHALGPVAFLRGTPVRYRVHATSFTQGKRRVMWLEGARALSDARKSAALRGDWEAWRQSWRGTVMLRRWCASDSMSYADSARRAHEPAAVVRHVGDALRASPPDVVRLMAKRLAGRV
jgi:glycosyltransferase involved in cell wall biosynthesis